jgi:hypothetical protein
MVIALPALGPPPLIVIRSLAVSSPAAAMMPARLAAGYPKTVDRHEAGGAGLVVDLRGGARDLRGGAHRAVDRLLLGRAGFGAQVAQAGNRQGEHRGDEQHGDQEFDEGERAAWVVERVRAVEASGIHISVHLRGQRSGPCAGHMPRILGGPGDGG